MFDAEPIALKETDRATSFGTIVVVGGGCYGAYYASQLARARAAGALDWNRVLVVDRDAECRVARMLAGEEARAGETSAGAPGPPPEMQFAATPPPHRHPFSAASIEIAVAPWDEFFADYLGRAAADPASAARDAIVPSPLMPHLMYEWLVARARARWPARRVTARPLPRPPNTPWTREAPPATTYVSFAEWMCPINCIEPPRCPVIHGPRSWSLPPALRAYVAAVRAEGAALLGPLLFHCVHRAFGVGMFDTRDVLDADAFIAEAGTRDAVDVLVGTVSHCHGALDVLSVA